VAAAYAVHDLQQVMSMFTYKATQDPTLIAGDGLHPSTKMCTGWADLVMPEALAALEGAGE
jgi:hypothetical protein